MESEHGEQSTLLLSGNIVNPLAVAEPLLARANGDPRDFVINTTFHQSYHQIIPEATTHLLRVFHDVRSTQSSSLSAPCRVLSATSEDHTKDS